MAFQIDLWTRFEFQGIPVYVRGDKPDWFVPNEAGDKILQELAREAAKTALISRPGGSWPGCRMSRCGLMRGGPRILATEHLRELWFHITDRCNQACRHCLFACSPAEKTELAAARILELAAQARELGCRVFALTGGEPLVHPDFESMVDSLLGHESRARGGPDQRHASEGLRPALARWPADRFHLQISVDGLGPNHDRIRGQGAFERLCADLAWLKIAKPGLYPVHVRQLRQCGGYAAAGGFRRGDGRGQSALFVVFRAGPGRGGAVCAA
jgi:7,8-dihydro-6-hydroxymethylpterin dimethyltransferase